MLPMGSVGIGMVYGSLSCTRNSIAAQAEFAVCLLADRSPLQSDRRSEPVKLTCDC